MNAYSELLNYFKQIGQPLVSTITQGSMADIDISKQNIMPLLHVYIGNASFPSDSVIEFSVEIGCFDVLDTNKEINDDKYYGNVNDIDIMNDTLAILNRIWQLMMKDFEHVNITASENPSLGQSQHEKMNDLIGWVMTFQVQVPNVEINLCQ